MELKKRICDSNIFSLLYYSFEDYKTKMSKWTYFAYQLKIGIQIQESLYFIQLIVDDVKQSITAKSVLNFFMVVAMLQH